MKFKGQHLSSLESYRFDQVQFSGVWNMQLYVVKSQNVVSGVKQKHCQLAFTEQKIK